MRERRILRGMQPVAPAARAPRSSRVLAALRAWIVPAAIVTALACNAERKAECDRFLEAMKPLAAGAPTADVVDRVQGAVTAIRFQDQPLGVYAKNYLATLAVLSSTLKLKETPSPPDGTDDVIKAKLKEARTDAEDTARYCAE